MVDWPGYPGGDTVDYGNMPSWLQDAMKKVSSIGPGAASRVGFSGPQDFSKLLSMYQSSLGMAPTEVGEERIRALYDSAIQAAMELGGEQIQAGAADRGAAVGGGVQRQQARDLALKVQQPLVESILGDASKGVDRQQSSLGQLFGAASGPQTTELSYRNTTADINSQLPPYVQQSDPNRTSGGSGGAGGSGGGGGTSGSGSGSGGGGSSTPWWQTSYGSMNAGAGAAYNEKNSAPGSLAGWNPGGVAGGQAGLDLNFAAAETPTGGGGHGLENIYDAKIAQGTQAPLEEEWRSYGDESGRTYADGSYRIVKSPYLR